MTYKDPKDACLFDNHVDVHLFEHDISPLDPPVFSSCLFVSIFANVLMMKLMSSITTPLVKAFAEPLVAVPFESYLIYYPLCSSKLCSSIFRWFHSNFPAS